MPIGRRAGWVASLLALTCAVSLPTRAARAADASTPPDAKEDEIEHTIVIGVGGATELDLGDGAMRGGGTAFVEWSAIPDWLSLEAGASVLAVGGGVEIPIELLFKKPFRIARGVEFMPGVGPEMVVVETPETRAVYFGGAAALDFMFWPSPKVGLWIEPGYDFVFRDGVTHGLGGTGGLIMGF
jgi:hypothetical protein